MPANAHAPSEIALRIVVLGPPPGVAFAMQIKRDELAAPVSATKSKLVFETRAKVVADAAGAPRFTGPAIQGPAGARFIYVNSGKRAGQADSCWDRRAKIPLTSVTWNLLRTAERKDGALTAEIEGLGKDGGPCCATVPLVGRGWQSV